MAKGFESQLNDILDNYNQVVKDTWKVAAKEVAEECVDRLRNVKWETDTGKRYSKTWKYKLASRGVYAGSWIVYNEKNYQLTHLLENGHVVRNAKGTFGRAPAHPHIEPVYKWAEDELQHAIRERLEVWGR